MAPGEASHTGNCMDRQMQVIPASADPVGDQSLPCLAKGETEVDGAVMPVACDLWHGHDRRHWDERVFTFWEADTHAKAGDDRG